MKIKLFFTVFILALFYLTGFSQDTRLWATYYGDAGYDGATNVATDINGNIYLSGITSCTSGIASGGFQNTYGGGDYDAFLVKFDSAGNRLWSTYYGGPGIDQGYGVATDATGNVYLAGYSESTSGISSGGFQNIFSGLFDAFLVKFDSAGNRLWATYYGGTALEFCTSVATDSLENVYLAGYTGSSTNISSGGFQDTLHGGPYDAFVVKFNSVGTRIWATYYGGIDNEEGNSLAVDASGSVYLAGYTSSNSYIASGGFQNTFGGGADAYLVKFDSAGNRLWATYYGGPSGESGRSAAVDFSDNIYLAGITTSTSGIAASGFQNAIGGVQDAFLVKFDSAGNRLWGTYYGGGATEETYGVVTDAWNNVFLSGDTYSTNGITSGEGAGGYQDELEGTENQFVVKFDSSGNRLCSTYYGHNHDEEGHIACDAIGNVYLSGFTNSTTGMASGGFQNTFGGGIGDGYLVKFASCIPTHIAEIISTINFTIYPNPTNQAVTLKFDNSRKVNCTLTLYDTQGQLARTIFNCRTDKVEIEGYLASGLYFFQLRTDKKIISTGKLVIE